VILLRRPGFRLFSTRLAIKIAIEVQGWRFRPPPIAFAQEVRS